LLRYAPYFPLFYCFPPSHQLSFSSANTLLPLLTLRYAICCLLFWCLPFLLYACCMLLFSFLFFSLRYAIFSFIFALVLAPNLLIL
jgi:hypothetical protein